MTRILCQFILCICFLSTAHAQFVNGLTQISVSGDNPRRDPFGNTITMVYASYDTLGGHVYPYGGAGGVGIAKFDPQGNLLWNSMGISGPTDLQLGDMDISPNGQVVFAAVMTDTVEWGNFTVPGHPIWGSFAQSAIGLLDSAGVLQWLYGFDNSDPSSILVEFLSNGNIAFCASVIGPAAFNGYNFPPSDTFQAHLVVLNPAGTVLHEMALDADAPSRIAGLADGPAGEVYAIGAFEGDSATWMGTTLQAHSPYPAAEQTFFTKVDSSGNMEWVIPFDSSSGVASDLVVAENGDCYFAGALEGGNVSLGGISATTNNGGSKVFLAGKITAAGIPVWMVAAQATLAGMSFNNIAYHPSGKLLMASRYSSGSGVFAGLNIVDLSGGGVHAHYVVLDSSGVGIRAIPIDPAINSGTTCQFVDSLSLYLGGLSGTGIGITLLGWPFEVAEPNGYVWWAEVAIQSNSLRGRHYVDLNNNSSFDPGDAPWPFSRVTTALGQPTLTDADGAFQLQVGTGPYTVSTLSASSLFSIAPPTYSGNFAGTGNFDSSLTFRSVPNQIIPDLQLELIAGAGARIGANEIIDLLISNQGSAPGGGTLALDLDPLTQFVSATPTPDTIQGNHIAWNIGSTAPFGSSLISATFSTDTTVALGDSLLHSANLFSAIADFDSSNQADTIPMIAVASYDPNDKQVSPSSVAPTSPHANGTAPLKYQIRFQNTGTAPAYRVIVRDTLPAGLDIASFRMLGSSHPYTLSLRNDNLLTWVFDPIVLPDSGTDLSGSNGFILFEIETMGGLVLGDHISNRCGIYFDYNAPVLTNHADFWVGSPPVAIPQERVSAGVQLYPNPGADGFGLKGLSPSQFPVKVAVYDLEGRCRMEKTVIGPSRAGFIPVENLLTGLFLVRVGTAKGEMLSFRWMHR